MNINKIIISGRLGKKPELKTAASGAEFCNFSVAVNRFKKQNEEQKADWFNCTAFGKMAAYICTYKDKGNFVVINGRMECEKKDDKIYWNLIVEGMDSVKESSDPKEDKIPDGYEPIPEGDCPF